MAMASLSEHPFLGRRLHDMGDVANLPREGTVVNVDGQMVHVVWADGSDSRVSIFRFQGPRAIRVLPIVVEIELLPGLILKAQRHRAEVLATQERAKVTMQEARKALAAENPHLVVAPHDYCAKTAAKNMRKELKLAGITASVRMARFSMGDSVSVCIDDASRLAEAKAIGDKYVGSRFDGMSDCSETISTAWNGCFGSTKYVHVRAESRG